MSQFVEKCSYVVKHKYKSFEDVSKSKRGALREALITSAEETITLEERHMDSILNNIFS